MSHRRNNPSGKRLVGTMSFGKMCCRGNVLPRPS